MGKKKKKKASKAMKVQERPISINIFVDGKPLCGFSLNNMKKAISEVGKNPFIC